MLRSFQFLLLLLLPALASAQFAVDAKINFGSLVTGGINVQADFAVAERFSVATGFGYAGNGLEVNGESARIRRLRFIPEARYYLSEPKSYAGADGFFVGGYGKLNRLSIQQTFTDRIENTNTYRGVLGFMLGNKWVTDGGLVVEVNGGAGAGAYFGGDATTSVIGTFLSTFDIRLGVLVGYRFGEL